MRQIYPMSGLNFRSGRAFNKIFLKWHFIFFVNEFALVLYHILSREVAKLSVLATVFLSAYLTNGHDGFLLFREIYCCCSCCCHIKGLVVLPPFSLYAVLHCGPSMQPARYLHTFTAHHSKMWERKRNEEE